ncbi:MAG: Transcriptional regulator [Parcubacteria group bacterium Gr01-1014_38]|nr:MAG: Transcriptional regulator [Parcubacteria group bacterium Gr01-1014_38]
MESGRVAAEELSVRIFWRAWGAQQRILTSIHAEVLTEYKLRPHHHYVLRAAQETDPELVSVQTIKTQLRIKPPAASRILAYLETRLLIERALTRVDRRRIGVRLTPQGRELMERVDRSLRKACHRLLSDLAPAERETLMALLGKIQHLQPASS